MIVRCVDKHGWNSTLVQSLTKNLMTFCSFLFVRMKTVNQLHEGNVVRPLL